MLDNLLENIFFKYLFTIFCFLVLMNGANFMDGVNTLLLGYFFILSVVCLLIITKYSLPFDIQNFRIIIVILSIILIFNFFGKLFSGDSGAYLISFIIGYFLIDFVNSTNSVSPYFVVCLLWYPAYESLFSIIRKKITNKPITDPDNRHLHHLIFEYFKQRLKLKGNFLNTASGLSINMVNIIIFYNAFQNISQTKNLILLIIISLLFYNFIYFYLSKTLK
jgi:UDP-N-acetylmuramyl pentapeptide phosphotransferase/UDP-N-acetylglucosamine-1-phosphate transferase